MGIFSEFLGRTTIVDTERPIVAMDRVTVQDLTYRMNKRDPDYLPIFDTKAEIQQVGIFANEVTSGNYTLTVLTHNGETFTTVNILYNANAATVETRLNTAATGTITGWTNGDISVSGGPLTVSPLVLTFDGASVVGKNHGLTTIADVDLTSDTVGLVTTTFNGVAAEDEVQSIAIFNSTVTGENYSLTFTLASAETFTTANIAYNANAATIETAIDVAATGNVVGWVNGDISVAGGDLTANPVTLTFDGDSVTGANHGLTVIHDVNLTVAKLGAVTTSQNGLAAANEVQNIAIFSGLVNSGNYTLNFTLADATNFITGNIIYDADATTIETAIDAAATGVVPSWVNGDITVSGGSLVTNPVVLTYDGTSVASANHAAVVIASIDLGGGGGVGAVTTTLNGVTPLNEEQGIAVFANPIVSGNYTLNFTLADATNFITSNIAYNASAAVIEAAVDVAATGVVGGWTNGDITITGGPLTAAPLTLVFDGLSVDGANHAATVIADVNLTANVLGTISVTNDGVVPVNEVQSIADFDGTVTSGNYTLTCTTNTPETFTTGNIAYSANATIIETAIDSAATGNIGGWTNGDISVSGGPLTTGAVTLTFDGGSVEAANHSLSVIADVNLVADPRGTIGTTTHGQEPRLGWAMLHEMGIIVGAPPVQGTTPTGLVLGSTATTNANWPRPSTLRAIAKQAAIDDNNIEVYNAIMALFHIQE